MILSRILVAIVLLIPAAALALFYLAAQANRLVVCGILCRARGKHIS